MNNIMIISIILFFEVSIFILFYFIMPVKKYYFSLFLIFPLFFGFTSSLKIFQTLFKSGRTGIIYRTQYIFNYKINEIININKWIILLVLSIWMLSPIFAFFIKKISLKSKIKYKKLFETYDVNIFKKINYLYWSELKGVLFVFIAVKIIFYIVFDKFWEYL